MVTLKDIAQELNVSIPLVSKVLNKSQGTTGVSAATAAKIREVADRLGYTRNRAAAALRMGRNNSIGVIVQRMGAAGSGIVDEILTGVADEAAAHEQQLELAFFQYPSQFPACLERIQRAAVDGLVFSGMLHEDGISQLLEFQRAGTPVVTVFGVSLHEELVNAGCDDERIGYVATKHLIDQGCKRIVHMPLTNPRMDGCRRAHEEAGVELIRSLTWEVREVDDIDFEEGSRAVDQLLDSKQEFDGIVAQCDLHAMGAMKALFRRGLRVPEDVRVIGVDNSPAGAFGVISLSSVSGDVVERSRQAVRMLMDRLDKKSVSSINVEPVLKVRESSR